DSIGKDLFLIGVRLSKFPCPLLFEQHNTGSAIPHTDKNYIENITFFLPNNGKINYFSKIFKRILLKKIVLEDEVYKLIELRDYLLPRLMSGEISV
ncbi:restriction endonuclease subunit S, partial [Fusobacterium mortiferum]